MYKFNKVSLNFKKILAVPFSSKIPILRDKFCMEHLLELAPLVILVSQRTLSESPCTCLALVVLPIIPMVYLSNKDFIF